MPALKDQHWRFQALGGRGVADGILVKREVEPPRLAIAVVKDLYAADPAPTIDATGAHFAPSLPLELHGGGQQNQLRDAMARLTPAPRRRFNGHKSAETGPHQGDVARRQRGYALLDLLEHA